MSEIMEIRQQVRLNQWSAMVREREDSGLNVKAFCKQAGIAPKTYYYRLRRLREAAIKQTQLGAVQPKTSQPELVQFSGSKLEDAVKYALNQEKHLRAFLNNGEVEISNNFAENAIRPFVIGRKNWLFSDTVKGAKSSAIVYSLIETTRANGVEPYAYLALVLTDMQYMGKPFSNEELESLMPWSEEMKQSIISRTKSVTE